MGTLTADRLAAACAVPPRQENMKTTLTALAADSLEIDADIVIVGAGPAGLSLAHALRNSGKRVWLIETGDDGPADAATRALSIGTNEYAYSPAPSEANRIRRIGGNATTWNIELPSGGIGVRMVELDDIDFVARPATGGVGWPLSKTLLQPWYDRAAALLDILPFGELPVDAGIQTDTVTTRFAQLAPVVSIIDRMKSETLAAASVTVVAGATLLGIDVTEGPEPKVETIVIGALSGRRLTIRPGVVVLACGGFENPRQLLMANRVRGTGLAAASPVGRYLMEHPMDASDFVRASKPDRDRRVFPELLDMNVEHNATRIGYLAVRPETVAERDLLGMSTWVYPRPFRWDPLEGPNALRFLAGRGVSPTYLRGRSAVRAKAVAAARVLTNPTSTLHWLSSGRRFDRTVGNQLAIGGWPAAGTGGYAFHNLTRIIEQAPHETNRVELGRGVDSFGLAQAHIVWKWREDDYRSSLRAKAIVDAEIHRLGMGTVIDRTLENAVPGAAHVIGSTRMGANPTTAVVDENCNVFGVRNLFLSGSSVFPTGGWANPTFTIVALSLRLAAHLESATRHPDV